MPKAIRFHQPNIGISFVINGLQNIMGREYIENIYPSQYYSMFFQFNSNGKNGAIIAYPKLDIAVTMKMLRARESIVLLFVEFVFASKISE